MCPYGTPRFSSMGVPTEPLPSVYLIFLNIFNRLTNILRFKTMVSVLVPIATLVIRIVQIVINKFY